MPTPTSPPIGARCFHCGHVGPPESFPDVERRGGLWEVCPECGSDDVADLADRHQQIAVLDVLLDANVPVSQVLHALADALNERGRPEAADAVLEAAVSARAFD